MRPAETLVCRRLQKVGINPDLVPRHGGILPSGYALMKLPVDIRAVRRSGYRIPLEWHPWRAPASTVMGILAAMKAADRA